MAPSFRLARLLRLRAQLRSLKEAEVEQLATRLDAAEAGVREVGAARRRHAAAEQAAAGAGRLTADELQLGRVYDAALAERERRCGAVVEEIRAALAAKRAQLIHQHREERKVRTLEEQFNQRASEAEQRRAERTLDELVIDRHERVRRRGNDGQP
jgi:flagellar export protein FliJ